MNRFSKAEAANLIHLTREIHPNVVYFYPSVVTVQHPLHHDGLTSIRRRGLRDEQNV
jgi:hypothetical protein